MTTSQAPLFWYVLVTPARNEGKHLDDTIQAMLHQTVLPQKWVIVSDASTDNTDKIAKSYAAQHPFIEFVRREHGEGRNFGSKVYAIRAGLPCLSGLRYDFIGNLDADITLAPDYFERLYHRFQAAPQLGIGGGVVYEDHEGKIIPQHNQVDLNVAGAVQLFRRACFEQIGGYHPLPRGGVDALADLMARMYGWEVRSFPELIATHARLAGTEISGLSAARIRQGQLDYSFGYHPLFELSKCVARVREKPYFTGSLLRLWGYVRSWLRREPVAIPAEASQWLRQEQLARLLPFLSPPARVAKPPVTEPELHE